MLLIDFVEQKCLKRLNEHIASKRMPLSILTEKIEKNGFKINHIDENQFYYKYVDGTTMLNHFFIMVMQYL